MPLPTSDTLQTFGYETHLALSTVIPMPSAAPATAAVPTLYRNEHAVYTDTNCRVTYGEQVHHSNPNMRVITAQLAAGGDTLYMPFFNDKITSLRLTWPPPAGVHFFFTDNLSGCRIYVDRPRLSNDIIVYHANTTAHTAGGLGNADFQTPGATNRLDALHDAAVNGEYAALNLNPETSLAMPRYFRKPAEEERRKTLQGRKAIAKDANPIAINGVKPPGRKIPKFGGGCTVVGFAGRNKWNLYFQTWGRVSYSRPNVAKMFFTGDWLGLHKRRTKGEEQSANYGDMSVIEAFQFF